MNLILAAVNAKYIHTNLAVRYLYKCVSDICDTEIREYSINDNILSVERDIIISKPDILTFSCYIWNIDFILSAAANIKKALPDTVIILGGPEVSFDACELMTKHSFIDYIIKGEGEHTLSSLVTYINSNGDMPVSGLTYRKDGKIIDTPISHPVCFADIPFPYDDMAELTGKIVYYESSRGCPYSCKYCLSGERGKVRFKDIELVKKDLKFFSDSGVPLVKFVDRTFNADRRRAMKIWQYISELNTDTRFHMEITGEILDDDTIELLSEVNPENLQFEIGVQSTNPETLSAIDRTCAIDRLFDNVRKLLDRTGIHIHLDLIAGLPYENMASFRKSFNDVLSLRPHVLQLGFLKLLKGSSIREEADKYGMVYRDNAPYEIIFNDFMSADDIIFLKDMDFVFDKYYNSGSFTKTIDYLFNLQDNKFSIFTDIVNFYRCRGYIGASLSKQKLYDILYECYGFLGRDFEEALRYDYIFYTHSGKLPSWADTDNEFTHSQLVFDFLKDEDAKRIYIPHFEDRAAKSLIKHVRFEKFSYGILMFDYENDSVYDVTEYFNSVNS